MTLEPWKLREFRRIFRDGVLPQWSDRQLAAVGHALATDDPSLIQERTTRPTYRAESHNGHVLAHAGCLVCYPGWRCGVETIGALDSYFAEVTHRMMMRTNPRDVEFFFEVFDGADRAELWPVLLGAVKAEEARRTEAKERAVEDLVAAHYCDLGGEG